MTRLVETFEAAVSYDRIIKDLSAQPLAPGCLGRFSQGFPAQDRLQRLNASEGFHV
jgi:hypothetical protein